MCRVDIFSRLGGINDRFMWFEKLGGSVVSASD